MVIDISTIPADGLDLEFENEAAVLGLENSGAEFLTELRAELRLFLSGRTVFITGLVNGRVKLQCVRCLDSVSHEIRQNVQVHLDPIEGTGDAKDEGHELHRSELDRLFYLDDRLDLAELVREQILLDLPVYPLCRENCLGLCPSCGQDFNRQKCACELKNIDHPSSPFRKHLKNVTLKSRKA